MLCALALTALAFALCACGEDYWYENAEDYRIGGVTLDQMVDSLDIDWIDGRVTVVRGQGTAVTLNETSPKDLEERDLLRWWLDGSTLRVRYAENGHHTFDKLEKELTVTLPEGELTSLAVTTRSAAIHVDQAARSVSLQTASGTVDARCGAARAEINTASGSVHYTDDGLSSGGEGLSLDVSTASGGVTVTAERVKSIAVHTASGAVRITADSVDQMDVQSGSGSITLTLPADSAGFAADITTASGEITDALGMRRENGRYVFGDGHASVRLQTASGHITVEPLKDR